MPMQAPAGRLDPTLPAMWVADIGHPPVPVPNLRPWDSRKYLQVSRDAGAGIATGGCCLLSWLATVLSLRSLLKQRPAPAVPNIL